MRRDFDSGRAIKTSRALVEKTSLVAVLLTKLASSAASNSFPLPGAPVIRYACASRFCSWARRKNSSAVVRAKAISRIRCLCQRRKTRRKRFPNLFFDLVDFARAIDHDNALGPVRREVAISFADTLIKFGGLLFHPIRFAWLTLHSRLSSSSIHIEHESDVRYAIADDERIHALDHLAIQFACRSLIDGRGITETICDHTHAAFERGLDYLAHQLAATSLKKKQLSLGCHVRVMRSKLQKVSDTFADRRAAGFTRQQMRHAGSLKACRQSLGLCGLSASL